VVGRLNDDGFVTVTPTARLDPSQRRGDRAAHSRQDPCKKVLVGHSYGGEVITDPPSPFDVVSLVYTAAFAPDQGESLASLGAGYSPPAALPHLISAERHLPHRA